MLEVSSENVYSVSAITLTAAVADWQVCSAVFCALSTSRQALQNKDKHYTNEEREVILLFSLLKDHLLFHLKFVGARLKHLRSTQYLLNRLTERI